MIASTAIHPLRRLTVRGFRPPAIKGGWVAAIGIALLGSTVTWASLPAFDRAPGDQREWAAGTPLSGPAPNAHAIPFTAPAMPPAGEVQKDRKPVEVTGAPVRIDGVTGDEGLYWALRSSGASSQVAAEYLAALATETDVGDIGRGDRFDLVLGRGNVVLYAGLDRFGQNPLELVRWPSDGHSQWIDAAGGASTQATQSGLLMPAAGHITSPFGYRYHPILHFVRFHAGIDIGASWGSPIVAAADGHVVAAGWAGGYGRQVQIAHAGGYVSSYSHMSEFVAAPGTEVHAGQVIGYVGSSGLSTGPHVHFEVKLGGTPVNPFSVHLSSTPAVDPQLAKAAQARLKALLAAATREG